MSMVIGGDNKMGMMNPMQQPALPQGNVMQPAGMPAGNSPIATTPAPAFGGAAPGMHEGYMQRSNPGQAQPSMF